MIQEPIIAILMPCPPQCVSAAPHVVFHLAAQPLVREGYRDPLGTFATNLSGTANLLEAACKTLMIWAVIVVTTDKVYQNREWLHPYREADPLGGCDPYSASKAAAEIVTARYRSSYFGKPDAAWTAMARAGNVNGGGDWAKDLLIPDSLPRSRRKARKAPVSACRAAMAACAGTWNFGPDAGGGAEVGTVAKMATEIWGTPAHVQFNWPTDRVPHEAGLLRLDSTLACRQQASRC